MRRRILLTTGTVSVKHELSTLKTEEQQLTLPDEGFKPVP